MNNQLDFDMITGYGTLLINNLTIHMYIYISSKKREGKREGLASWLNYLEVLCSQHTLCCI